MLQWMGLTTQPTLTGGTKKPLYPQMKHWLRNTRAVVDAGNGQPSAREEPAHAFPFQPAPAPEESPVSAQPPQRPELNLPYLRGYLQRTLDLQAADSVAVDLDFALLSGLGLGLQETLQFLHQHRPTLTAFEAWIIEKNDGAMDEPRLERLRRALDGEVVGPEVSLDGVEGLSEEELRHWVEHGYVVLRQAVSPEQARAAEMAIYTYLSKAPDDPESWYGGQQGHTIWVSLLRHPAFWANRRAPRIAKAFAQLWGRDDLWASVDQGGFNPPERPNWPFPGPHLHWDTTLAEPHHFNVQGVLYLTDTAEDQGAFTCIPGFHRKLKPWLAALGSAEDPRRAILNCESTAIAAAAGDMVIWHHHLPHAASPNRATKPRVVQYITLKPTRWDHHGVWK
jgi:hypothetical protein